MATEKDGRGRGKAKICSMCDVDHKGKRQAIQKGYIELLQKTSHIHTLQALIDQRNTAFL